MRRLKIWEDGQKRSPEVVPHKVVYTDGTEQIVENIESFQPPADKEVATQEPLQEVDEEYDGGTWVTWKSVIEQVAAQWGKPVPQTEEEIKAFVEEFSALPFGLRQRYGVWADKKPEEAIFPRRE